MLVQIAGPQGSWSDKIVRVSTMSGHNGSYFISQYLDTLAKIYPQFEELFSEFKHVVLALYQLDNNQFVDRIAFEDILNFAIKGLTQHHKRVSARVLDYEQKTYRDHIDK